MKTGRQNTHMFLNARRLVSLESKQCASPLHLSLLHSLLLFSTIMGSYYLLPNCQNEKNTFPVTVQLSKDLESFMIWLQVLLSLFSCFSVLESPPVMHTGRPHPVDTVLLNDNPAPIVALFARNQPVPYF